MNDRFLNRREFVQSWNLFTDTIRTIPWRIEKLLRRKILFEQLNYRDRVFIAAFCFQNGVLPDTLSNMLHLNENATASKINKIVALYTYWSADNPTGQERRSRYWAYDIIIGRICDLNGYIVSRERQVRRGQ